jgi:hypothetical protein
MWNFGLLPSLWAVGFRLSSPSADWQGDCARSRMIRLRHGPFSNHRRRRQCHHLDARTSADGWFRGQLGTGMCKVAVNFPLGASTMFSASLRGDLGPLFGREGCRSGVTEALSLLNCNEYFGFIGGSKLGFPPPDESFPRRRQETLKIVTPEHLHSYYKRGFR